MALVNTGHHHFHFHAFDGIGREIWLTWLHNATTLMCLMALVTAMWVGGNLSALMHTLLMGGVSSLGVAMILVCTSMALSLTGLIRAGLLQLCMEQIDAPAT